ncbi:hypothetical protein ACL8E2_28985 [Pseudomonas aeruginosa]|uniref:hypothetical protein n=2 Tax=Pseudomonas aeruginosa TaxID=287 RepID=UPI003B67B3E5
MTNELTDVRCPCGTEFPAESYDAGFIAGSGMCQNCDAALPPKDICTCPSGDGSLRHPCPAHPASVELAGVAANLTFINGRPAMCGCQVEYSSGGGEYSDVIYVTLCAKHSGSAILDLVATNRIALTPEYEGQWHADLYLDREIPLAKAEGATPAEAVLALMSAERIDPEQESVGQAGGDERAAFFKHLIGRHPAHETEIVRVVEHNYAAWKAWQARAALAQPSPTLPPFAEKVLTKLRRFNECAEDPGSGGVDIGRHWLDLLTQLGPLNRVQRSPALWEISQQGEDLLGMPQPSPAQAEKAEVERPEVAEVAFVLRNIGAMDAEDIDGDNVDLRFEDAEGRDTGCDVSIVEYAEKAADLFEQHDRIVGALRAENAKLSEALDRWPLIRDSLKLRLADALARVEELEKELAMARDAAAKGDAARRAAGGMEMEIQELREKVTELQKELRSRWTYASTQATNCAGCGEYKHTPLRVDWMGGYVCLTCIDKKLEELHDDQAQHSVPEGYALIPVRETEAMHDAVMALLYKGVARTDTQKLLDAYIAAVPGKEVGHE